MLENNIQFPTETEVVSKLKESTISAEFINTINDVISKIIGLNSRQPPQKSNTFIEKLTPLILSAIVVDGKLPSSLEEQGLTFIHNYVQLITVIDLIGKLLSGICNVLPKEFRDLQSFSFNPPEDEEYINKIYEFSNPDEFLQPNVKKLSKYQQKLIEEVFKLNIFRHFFEVCSSDQLTNTTISGFIQFSKCLFNLLQPTSATAILEQIIKCFIPHLVKYPDIQVGPQYLLDLIRLIPTISNTIMAFLCEIMLKQTSSNNVAINVLELPQALESEAVKKAVIEILSQPVTSKHPKLMQTVASMLPKLSANMPFTATEILSILSQKSLFDEYHCNLVNGLILDMKESPEPIADFIISSDHFNARLIMTLIQVIPLTNSFSKILFERLMRDQDKLSPLSMKGLIMNDSVRKLIQNALDDTNNIQLIQKIAYFYKNASYLKDTSNFLLKLANVSITNPELLPSLDMFSSIIFNIDSKNLLLTMFKMILQSMFDAKRSIPPGLIRILSHWLAQAEELPEKEIIELLGNIDYSNCPTTLPILVDIITERAVDKDLIEKFVFKIATDTVKPKLAKWAVNIIFSKIHQKADNVHKFVDPLVQHLSDPDKCDNASRMIYESVLYETDFFECKSPQSLSQQFTVKDINKKMTMIFHPFHSSRYIYWRVSRDSGTPINNFDLYFINDGVETPILYGMPLTELSFIGNKNIKLVMKQVENKERMNTEPTFIRYLAKTGIDAMMKVLDFVSPTSERIFQILMLLAPIKTSSVTTPLQKVVVGEGCNPMEFVGSSKVLPYAIALTNDAIPNDVAQGIVEVLVASPLDHISMSIAVKFFPKIVNEFVFTADMIRRGMIMSKSVPLRQMFLELAKKTTDPDPFVACLPDAIKVNYRANTEQFFEALKLFKLNSDIFTPFFEDLPQYEDSYYIDPDETLIQLLSLIPKTKETTELVIKRLFMMPTVEKPISPFILSSESREAAFNFLQNDLSTSILLTHVNQIPSIPSVYLKFSDDFTYRARSGLYNLGSTCYINAVLQCVNALPNVSNKILSLQGNDYPPFVMQLRELLARMRYTVEGALSVRSFVETLDSFNPDIQDDALIFYNSNMIENLSKSIGQDNDIIKELEGESTLAYVSISDGKELSSQTNNFYHLTVPINDLTNIDEGFKKHFSGYIVDYNVGDGTTVKAICKPRINKWPNYLVLQLERYEYTVGERIKLIHEFAFPIALDPNRISQGSQSVHCDFGYSLAGVIVHEGDVDNGHYFAIVQGDDKEWYYCNDHNLEYFDVTKMKQWSFGVGENASAVREKVWTGYLLFYKRSDIVPEKPHLEKTLQQMIDTQNAQFWPNVVFYSHQFLDFVMKHVKNSNFSQESIELAFICLFRISVIKDEILSKWCSFFENSILTNKDRANFIIKLIGSKLGKTFANLISISDSSYNNISSLVMKALDKLMDNPQSIITLIKCTDEFAHKRSASFTLDLIARCTDFNFDWPNEEELLLTIISYLESDGLKDIFKGLAKQHSTAFAKLMDPVHDLLMTKGITAPIFAIFSIDGINRLTNSARKSDTFMDLLQKIAKIRPSLYKDQTHASPQTKQILQQITIPTTDDTETFFQKPEVDTRILTITIMKTLFSPEEKERKSVAAFLKQTVGKPTDETMKFLNLEFARGKIWDEKICEESIMCQEIIAEIPVCIDYLSKSPEVVTEYLDLLTTVSCLAPFALSTSLLPLAAVLNEIDNENVIVQIVTCMVRTTAVIRDFINKVDPSTIDKILSLEITNSSMVLFLMICGEKSVNSNLLRANIEYYLSEESNDYCLLLADFVTKYGSCEFEIPDNGNGFEQLSLATSLWDFFTNNEKKKKQLAVYMISIFDLIINSPLFASHRVVKEAFERLKQTNCTEQKAFMKKIASIPWYSKLTK
ncbi:Clan CA, family C19, ubiquitin hydrolase-like cysteine peptidase [Trichomonas vaginalis G3]|uniref:Clan CA, family C19, ubiquitin hydrolase-like cysteine peptidase n=1 Tax=Trichomonas vaginalis (strain ATCC PRA-98 / G3) TaxID=412133 RepID=A2E722_TRIV3|nr:ubiquitinyl hydrolase protein [Trichomonas vaginalis G3]EAY11540.1 Clan CA, family C19, ubiquitin hydrolase-like cysteine peptidase [Trichomonas vaginalis G3]KAI5489424.1 ubiquitinyl hydrolase protein [Trichomonas vaginalis G3]|eukprot:XP_001323763.1 Clan CA, family C19, ubiquitin hydrolase-like cysteine peptidase [Trichomonas vaginalis G3]